MNVQNQRPGVYSRYDAVSGYTSPTSLQYAAVVAKSNGGQVESLYSFSSFANACEIFGSDPDGVFMRSIISILFECGVSKVFAVPVGDDYEIALSVLDAAENIGAIITDAQLAEDILKVKAYTQKRFNSQRECVAFCGIDSQNDACEIAEAVNFERIVITCPSIRYKENSSALYSAAALAGKILASGDAAANYNSSVFEMFSACTALPETEIQALLNAGVTVFENVGETVECIRALTTRTITNGAADRSMTGINTTLIIDDVMRFIRASLKLQLTGGRIGGAPIESIRSQVAVALLSKQTDGLIESFSPPRCYPGESDPGVCVVELSFTVAHVISQIHVTAHIQV